MMAEFFMPMVPPTTTGQMHKIAVIKGKPVVYDTPEIKAAKAKLRAHLIPHVPAAKYQGAVRLVAKWCWPCGEDHYDGEYKTTKPDTDNVEKMLKDVMEKLGFYGNDAQVASETCEKFWARVPGIWIHIEEIEAGR